MRLADGIRGTNLVRVHRLELFRVKRDARDRPEWDSVLRMFAALEHGSTANGVRFAEDV